MRLPRRPCSPNEKQKASESNAGKRYRSKQLEQTSAITNDGQMTIVLNGKVELPYCADSGSDWNVISQKHVQLLQGQGPTVKAVKLENAVERRAVGGSLLTSTHAVDISGPVRCQDPKRCLIVESDEDEVHVGKALLSDLGIDIEQQPEYLASRETGEDDHFEESDGTPPCRPSVSDAVMDVEDALVQDAIDHGVVDDYIDSQPFEVLGDDPPAKVPPLKIRSDSTAQASQPSGKFNKRLVEQAYVYVNRESRWYCPALPVRKPKTDEFRQTTDYRPLRAVTEAIAGVMPSLEVAFEHCKRKMFYAMFDYLKGFWQLPFGQSSFHMTDTEISRLPGYLKGARMLTNNFQSTVEMVLGDLVNKCMIVWIDDLLDFVNTQEELESAIRAVPTKLDDHGLILNPKKSTVFLKEIRWYGRIINQPGVGHDP
ncbi:Hypothetical protein PHPALM_411 [Phytophthora palmivora]|uniref:Reverse transcriptase domain-containing protein n=1 Tax=Phytophthora palmivora TaxID=4796 RepID=A0A2P4YUZ9_9STRA|nr:Hypothetical protein PHPALM_411 [Phytophthora palmivora]